MESGTSRGTTLISDDPELIAKLNRISTVSANMWMTVIGTLGIMFLPMMVSGIIDDLGFTQKQAGYVAAAEMAGVAIASGLGILWVRKVNWVTTAKLATLALIIANTLSMGVDQYWPMIVARLCGGLASGALLAIGLAGQSDSQNSDRIFGYWVACQMTVSSVGYLILPGIRSTWGIDGFLLALIVIGFTAFLSIPFLSTRGLNRTQSTEKQQLSIFTGAGALLGALLFFMAQGGLWAFLERMGLASGLTTTNIGFALAISSYFGIVGGLAKNWLADAAGLLSPFVFVVIGELFMLYLFATEPDNLLYLVAVCLLQFCWAMGMASLLGAFSLIDKSGGLVLLLISFAKIGYSLGPALMGWLITGADYTLVIFTSGTLVAVGIFISILLVKSRMNVITP